jgi:signal transduction histidine kinase
VRKGARKAFFAGSGLALLCLVASLVLPSFIGRDYDRKSLDHLKRRAGDVRDEFAAVLAAHQSLLERIRGAVPGGTARLFERLSALGFADDLRGAAYYGPDGRLAVWIGNAIDLGDHARSGDLTLFSPEGAPFVVRDKASVYLASVDAVSEGGHIALFRLLAFIPQFQSSYVRQFHFLKPALLRRCAVDYWSFREDVGGFERIFSKHADEFAGEPRRANEIQTLYFPLRGPDRRILATVTLSSPSLTERLTTFREDMLLGFFVLVIGSLLILLFGLLSPPRFLRGRRPGTLLVVCLLAAGLRVLFFPLSRLERVRSLSVFSPAGAGFFSLGGLTASPADIFLTSAAILLVVGCLMALAWPRLTAKRKPAGLLIRLPAEAAALAAGLLLFDLFEGALRTLVFNANVPLLRFSARPEFLLLHLSVLFCLTAVLASTFLALRASAVRSPGPGISLALTGPAVIANLYLSGGSPALFPWAAQAALLALGIVLAHAPEKARRREFVAAGLLFGTLFLGQAADSASTLRTRSLFEDFLRNVVTSQEEWGNLLVRESIPEIEKRAQAISSFMKEPGPPDFAHGIWDRTLAARFNWYSGLEVLDADGNALSRFSLNIPRIYGRELSLPPSRSWSVTRRSAVSLGRPKDVLVAYKDWFEGRTPLGRTLLFLSLDPETLPFLYSANPYFELLRSDSIPSLNAVDFGLAIYRPDGRPLLNPGKISSGIPPAVLERLGAPGTAFWGSFKDGGSSYRSFYFRHEGKVFSLYSREKGFRARVVEFLKLLALEALLILVLVLPAAIAARRLSFRNVFRSFSNRVYASFFAVALVPLLLFTIFTRGLFDRIFTGRFVEEAALHAGFARSIMEDFNYLQDGSRPGLPSPPEDLVLWVAATLANDVNLYRDAKLLSSSRREFFDAGLLPDLVDGAIYHSLTVEKAPFTTQRKRIGGYSFQTLTVPYDFRGSTFLVSMPFPFEKEEAARATGELVEFLLLLALLFAGFVFAFARGIRAMIVVPVRKLLAGTREVSLGNLDVAIEHPSRDEMRTLVEGFNAMVGSLRAHRQELAEMGKKVAWAEMARKVAHEIKNPLTPIQLSAEHVLRVYEDRDGDFEKALRESMSYIIGEVEHLRRVAQEFMEIARDTSVRRDPCDLRRIVAETLDPYRKLLSARIRFRESYEGEAAACLGDEAKLRTAFRNIVANAIESIRDKGEVVVAVRRSGPSWAITVHDTGAGMTPAVLGKIFEPYFSTKDAGTGLGLPITRKIVEDHGGSVRVESEPGKGTTVTVDLPAGP